MAATNISPYMPFLTWEKEASRQASSAAVYQQAQIVPVR
ncbi:hypothetical protein J2T20_000412 [Paenibacillus wynnii]|nr:hypothetical protein [Paenibacillus wynnii]